MHHGIPPRAPVLGMFPLRIWHKMRPAVPAPVAINAPTVRQRIIAQG